jgi:hypothetical protein
VSGCGLQETKARRGAEGPEGCGRGSQCGWKRVLTADALITACRADIRPAADAAFATLPPHLSGAVRDTTIAEHAEIPIYCPGGLVDTTPARPSLRHLRQNHHRLTDAGPWARTARLRMTNYFYPRNRN